MVRRKEKRILEQVNHLRERSALDRSRGHWIWLLFKGYFFLTVAIGIYGIIIGKWWLFIGIWIAPILAFALGGGLTATDVLYMIWLDGKGKGD